jgi:hypothetical protein
VPLRVARCSMVNCWNVFSAGSRAWGPAKSGRHSFCERPAYVEGESGPVLDFWVNQGRHAKFWVVSSSGSEKVSLPKTVRGIRVRVLQRADLIAMATRIQLVADLFPYRICFVRYTDNR